MAEDKSNEINVAKYIIQNTPIGHLEESIENLKIVCGEEVMDQDPVKSQIISYQEDHLAQIPVNDSKSVISKLNKDENGFYYDMDKQVKFKVSPEKSEATDIENIEDNSSLRKAIEKNIKSYRDQCYKSNIAKVNVYAENEKINVLISAHNFNAKNFWSGEWLSTWELQGKKVVGKIRANTYYYEEGNIQFNLAKDFNEEIGGDDEETLAKNLVELIKKKENDVQMDLEKVYDNFSEEYIKPLRRKLPVTGTKMNWSLHQIQYGKKN